MEAPQNGMSSEDFNGTIKAHIAANYEKTQNGYKCKKCGSDVIQATGYASIHSTEFGDTCAGSGKVEQFPLPYCPNCEGEPTNLQTCVHVPLFS